MNKNSEESMYAEIPGSLVDITEMGNAAIEFAAAPSYYDTGKKPKEVLPDDSFKGIRKRLSQLMSDTCELNEVLHGKLEPALQRMHELMDALREDDPNLYL